MKKISVLSLALIVSLFSSWVLVATAQESDLKSIKNISITYPYESDPLRIPIMKNIQYPGSEIVIEEVLPRGSKYTRYTVSYVSNQKTIYGIMAIPNEFDNLNKYPAILMAHGYIPPKEYEGKSEYSELIDLLAKNGYVVFMPDLSGHGLSEGNADGAYFSPTYTVDFLNAFASLARYKGVNSEQIGLWGHSMGGHIVLRTLVTKQNIKSAVIWSGVVGSYHDLLYNWKGNTIWRTTNDPHVLKPENIYEKYGSPIDNLSYWDEIDPLSYLKQVTAKIQLHHTQYDSTVPAIFSWRLYERMVQHKIKGEYHTYHDDDHEMTGSYKEEIFGKTLQFFDTSLQ